MMQYSSDNDSPDRRKSNGRSLQQQNLESAARGLLRSSHRPQQQPPKQQHRRQGRSHHRRQTSELSAEQYREVLTFAALATGGAAEHAAASPMGVPSPPVYGAVTAEQQGRGSSSWYDPIPAGNYPNDRPPSSSQSAGGGGGGGGGITGLFTGFMDRITGHSEDDADNHDDGADDSFDVSVGDEEDEHEHDEHDVENDFYDNVSEDTEEGRAAQYAIEDDDATNDDDDDDDERTRASTLYGDDIGIVWHTFHRCVYDPSNPEFSSTQQFTWAVVLGGFFGVFTAVWGAIIEGCVEVVWVDVPERLLEAGVFTDLEGRLPLPHYMWICPAVLGGVSCLFDVEGDGDAGSYMVVRS